MPGSVSTRTHVSVRKSRFLVRNHGCLAHRVDYGCRLRRNAQHPSPKFSGQVYPIGERLPFEPPSARALAPLRGLQWNDP